MSRLGRSRLADAPVHLREGLRLVLRRPVTALIASLTLGLGLSLGALAVWSHARLADAQHALEGDLVLFAALDPALDQAGTEVALKQLAAEPSVKTVRWIGPREQRARLGAIVGADLLEGLDDAVFPAGGLAEVALVRGAIADSSALDAFKERLASIEAIHGIEGFPFDFRHIQVLLDAARVSRLLGLTLALIALLAAGLAVFQFTRGELLVTAPTLTLLRDFGATATFVRARFFVAASTIGAAGAACGVAVVWLTGGALGALVSIVPGLEGSGPGGALLYVWAGVGASLVAAGGCALALRGEGRMAGARASAQAGEEEPT